jgi:hypothetical protein
MLALLFLGSIFYPIPWVIDAESITTGPDGDLWFADHVAAAVGRVTTACAFTKFHIPGSPGTNPVPDHLGIGRGLVVHRLNGHRVGQITMNGQVSFFVQLDRPWGWRSRLESTGMLPYVEGR